MTEEMNATHDFLFEDPEICSCVFWEELVLSHLPRMEQNRPSV